MNNKYYIVKPKNDLTIDIPIEMQWDFYGKSESIELYEADVIKQVVGREDFEILRFSYAPYLPNGLTQLNYDFFFYNNSNNSTPPSNTVTASTYTAWTTSYLVEGFSSTQVYYYENAFTKSFFKLDFYDRNDSKNQTLYFTVIIPVQQGKTETALISAVKPPVQIKKPSFTLDFVGDKEGFFLYWLRTKNYIDLSTFYMTAKFFDASIGQFVKMMNVPQSNIASNKFTFNESIYFYYKVKLDYDNKTYSIYNVSDVDNLNRIGAGTPIKWYEYINPPSPT